MTAAPMAEHIIDAFAESLANGRILSGIVCGLSECPTCGRMTEALIGPCAGCCESHASTGRFLRRNKVPYGGSDG